MFLTDADVWLSQQKRIVDCWEKKEKLKDLGHNVKLIKDMISSSITYENGERDTYFLSSNFYFSLFTYGS